MLTVVRVSGVIEASSGQVVARGVARDIDEALTNSELDAANLKTSKCLPPSSLQRQHTRCRDPCKDFLAVLQLDVSPPYWMS